MRVLCVIPVRGGSKGIPRKNIKPIAGKPLVAWTIEQALAAQTALAGEHTVDVLVSTDDAEIAEVARAHGAQVPFMRPTHLAEDTTATEPVVEHAIEFYTAAGQRGLSPSTAAACKSPFEAIALPPHGPGSPSSDVKSPPASCTIGTSAAMS